VTPATIQTAQRLATSAIEMLESGNEDQASAELQRALQNDPNNKLAQSLLKQIQNDPVATLGRENFPYRVQPGESLSKIAQRFLGDVHLFYVLARYNDLRVPKQLQSGQMIKVPGKAPPVTSAAPSPAPATSRTPSPAATPAPVEAPAAAPAPAAQATPAVDPAKQAERERANKVAAATKAARSAYARQDLVAAIRHWDAVLELDAGNTNAKIERQRAVDLKAKLDRLK
jgi:LysM repeat protein